MSPSAVTPHSPPSSARPWQPLIHSLWLRICCSGRFIETQSSVHGLCGRVLILGVLLSRSVPVAPVSALPSFRQPDGTFHRTTAHMWPVHSSVRRHSGHYQTGAIPPHQSPTQSKRESYKPTWPKRYKDRTLSLYLKPLPQGRAAKWSPHTGNARVSLQTGTRRLRREKPGSRKPVPAASVAGTPVPLCLVLSLALSGHRHRSV